MTVTTVCDEIADAAFEYGYPVSHVEVKIDTPYRSGLGRGKPGRGRIGLSAIVTWDYRNVLASEPALESNVLCTTSSPIEADTKVRWGISSAGPGIFHLVGLRVGS